MTDLNDWRLTYDDVRLDFGTLRTGYPFTQQVAVGAPELRTDDAAHPSTDGSLFGIDMTGGMTLTFGLAIPPYASRGVQPEARVWDEQLGEIRREWDGNLDMLERFKLAWKARTLRRRPGAVAQVTNLDRGRAAYGRPRNLTERLDKTRQGWTEFLCDFVTADDRFYSLDVESVVLTPVPASGGGFTWPIEWPVVTATTSARVDVATNRGTESTWPSLTITGPSVNPGVRLRNRAGETLWELWLDASLTYSDVATISAVPWARGVQINGSAALGRLRGDPLDLCELPPGEAVVEFTGKDVTGTARLAMSWQHAYASL